ncbi:MAG TPA: c-type cytochrome [Caldilineaceae bacterium]|nr:c-type cytochrome [Caldilineaceae bacterium]
MSSGGWRRLAVWGLVAATLAGLSACGGGSSNRNAASSAATTRAVPTMPAARFAMPTTMITVAPRVAVTATAEATATSEPQAGPTVDLARGERLYNDRGCAECHGPAGEGVEGKGAAIAGTALSEDEFTDLMRTGGGIGPDHLYGPSAISPSGMTALHAWLQSLPPAE